MLGSHPIYVNVSNVFYVSGLVCTIFMLYFIVLCGWWHLGFSAIVVIVDKGK